MKKVKERGLNTEKNQKPWNATWEGGHLARVREKAR